MMRLWRSRTQTIQIIHLFLIRGLNPAADLGRQIPVSDEFPICSGSGYKPGRHGKVERVMDLRKVGHLAPHLICHFPVHVAQGNDQRSDIG